MMAGSLVRLQNSEITASVRGGIETGGGDISLDTPLVLLQDSRIRAQAFEGRGGNIRITAQAFLADSASEVNASSELGIDGTVEIQALTNLHATVSPLPQHFRQSATLLRNQCAARRWEGTISSLVLAGRHGVPPSPGGVLPSPLAVLRKTTADTGIHTNEVQMHRHAEQPLEFSRIGMELACGKR